MVRGELVRPRATGPADADALRRGNHDPDVGRMREGHPRSRETVGTFLQERGRKTCGDVVLGIGIPPRPGPLEGELPG